MKHITPCLAFILLIISSLCLSGQSDYAAAANRRIALVIGNGDYDTGPLLNPGNDARAMAGALRETGFEVMEYIDVANQADMKRVIREFGRKIQNGGVGLFYYAGHGIQVNGRNFLVPTKAQIYAEEEVEYESVDVGFVMSQMEIARNRMNIIILDACRNNPFARSWRSAATGLAFINAPTGTLIAYSTAPGSVASDGTGANGLYTEELLRQIRLKGLKIEDVFKNVRSEVLDKSNNMQTPWESSSLVGDFYFIRPDAVISETGIGETGSRETVAEAISSGDHAEWIVSSGKYFFYLNGMETTVNTTAATAGQHVLLYDQGSGRSYLLEDFWNIKDEGKRAAKELPSGSDAFWMRNAENWFWFFLKGQEVTKVTNNAYYGNNLVIYHKQEGKYFVMYNYANATPGEVYQAFEVFSPNNTLWWADEQYYFLYLDGIQVAARTWSRYSGNDLIVHDEESSSSFMLRNHYNLKDKKLRPAEILFRPGLITCTRGQDNKYFLYKNNKPYYMDGPSAFSDRDFLVYDTVFQQYVIFEDYLDTPFNVHIVGKPMYSRTDAVWRRKEGIYYLYIRGVLQTDDKVRAHHSLTGSDLEVTEIESGTVWILPDYANRQDNILRPAELKASF